MKERGSFCFKEYKHEASLPRENGEQTFCHIKHNVCTETYIWTDRPPSFVVEHAPTCDGTLQEWPFASTLGQAAGWGSKGAPATPTSQLWKQNFILTLRGGCKIGDCKAFEGRNYSLGLIIGLQGKAGDRGGTQAGGQISNLCIEMLMKERTFSWNCSFARRHTSKLNAEKTNRECWCDAAAAFFPAREAKEEDAEISKQRVP